MTRDDPHARSSGTGSGGTPPGFGVPPGAAVPSGPSGTWMRACPGCGSPIASEAIACPWCMPAFCTPRSKRRAVLLAVFLSFWTWAYTYRRDRKKFWAGLLVAIAGLCVPVTYLGTMVMLAVWCWAIADTVVKPRAWYGSYPVGK